MVGLRNSDSKVAALQSGCLVVDWLQSTFAY